MEETTIVYICDHFIHNPKQADKGDDHWHVCDRMLTNLTGRCGFNSAMDSKMNCILYECKKKRTTL